MFLDNFKIRTKLIMIYIVCVLLPVFVTAFVFMQTVTQDINKEERHNMENALERASGELTAKINSVTAISDYLYMNERLNTFIEQTYSSPVEYYKAFDRFLEDSVIRYYYTTESVCNIQICTDNPGIISGTYFCSRDEVMDSVWYQKYLQNQKRIIVFAYYEENNVYEQSVNRRRHISLIRKLDNFGGDAVMKIDFDYEGFVEVLDYEVAESDIYVSDGEKIILQSEMEKDGSGEYLLFEDIKKKELTVSKNVKVIGDMWEVILTKNKYGVWKALEGRRDTLFIFLLINLLLPSVLIVMVDRSFRKRMLLTEQYINKVRREQFEVIPGSHGRDEIGNLILNFNRMVLKIKELIEVICKKDVEQKDMMLARNRAELEALKRQINPHFLYNTLESIRMHSLVKGEKETAEMMGRFSFLLRQVTHWPEDFVEVEEEASAVNFYLEIQKNRFGKRLEYTVYIQEETKKLEIPKFSILTFVENSCMHGIEPLIEGGSINVNVTSDEAYIYMEVIDSGRGMEEEELEKLRQRIEYATLENLESLKSIGILNTVIRLKMYFTDNVEFEIDSRRDQGTKFFIKIPQTKGVEKC